MSTRLTLGVLAMVIAGCTKVTEAPVPELSQTGQVTSPTDVVLSVGTEVRVDSLLRVGFLDVPADSRCPATALCFWAGDGGATLALAVGTGPSYPHTVHTTLDPHAVEFNGYRITLVDLMPYPYQPGPIPLDAYAVRLHVERVAP